MGLVVLEGCEDFLVWGPSSGTPTFIPGRSGNCINCGSSTGLIYFLHPHQESDIVTVGFAMRYITHSGSGLPAIMHIGSDAGVTTHVEVGVSVTGQIEVRRSSTTIPPTSAVGVIQFDRWHYIEVQAKLSDTAGQITVRVDGAQVISTAANVDTKNAGTKTVFDWVRVYSSSTNNVRFDDIYLMTGAGDTFLGPISVETLRPVGNGAVNQWVGSDGDAVDNWMVVDDPTVDTNNYVYSATVGQQDLYTMSDLQRTSGTIVGVCHATQAIRTDAVTARSVKLLNRRAAINAGPAVALTTGYRGIAHSLALDPETGAAWTVANVNALQSGIELA